eukprot:gene15497-18408_t
MQPNIDQEVESFLKKRSHSEFFYSPISGSGQPPLTSRESGGQLLPFVLSPDKLMMLSFKGSSPDFVPQSPNISNNKSSLDSSTEIIIIDKAHGRVGLKDEENQSNETPCSCPTCYFGFKDEYQLKYQYLKRWIDCLEPACFSSSMNKVVLRVYHNAMPSAPLSPSPSPFLTSSSSTSSSTSSCIPNNLLSSPMASQSDQSGADSFELTQLQHECHINHGFSRDYFQQSTHFLDLEKPLALPFNDIDAVVPLSIVSSLLSTSIKDLKIRVCIDLPYSKRKEEDVYNVISKVEKLSEIGLLTYDLSDSSSACKGSQTVLSKVFSTLFASPLSFINLKRLFMVTTMIDRKILSNLGSQLPNLSGLHLSVWNNDIKALFDDITSSFGAKLQELGLRFTKCNGVKYETTFSHRDKKLDDSTVEQLVKRCPQLVYFSFEGWLSNLSDLSLRSLGRVNN